MTLNVGCFFTCSPRSRATFKKLVVIKGPSDVENLSRDVPPLRYCITQGTLKMEHQKMQDLDNEGPRSNPNGCPRQKFRMHRGLLVHVILKRTVPHMSTVDTYVTASFVWTLKSDKAARR